MSSEVPHTVTEAYTENGGNNAHLLAVNCCPLLEHAAFRVLCVKISINIKGCISVDCHNHITMIIICYKYFKGFIYSMQTFLNAVLMSPL